MKRSPQLRDLSADHHHGLALARRVRRASDSAEALGAAWAEVEATFAAELEPHFVIEETMLAPALEARGEVALAKRLHEEHAALRAFLAPGADRSHARLQRFGELLEQHIRFEEREFFEVAQAVLDADVLRAVEEESRKRRT